MPKTYRRNYFTLDTFGLAVIFYFCFGAFLLKYYNYQINNLDAISYISIARKYLAGDFANAINGFWGPLISWSLVPLLICGIPPLLSGRIITLIIGFITIIGVRVLASILPISESLRNIILNVNNSFSQAFQQNNITTKDYQACGHIY